MKTIKHTFLMFLFIPGIKCVIYRRRETGNTGDVQKLIAHLQNVLRNVDHMWCISTIPKKKQRKIEQPPPLPEKKVVKFRVTICLWTLPGDIQKLIAHLQNVLRNVDHMWCISTIPKKKQRKIEQPLPLPEKRGQIPRHHVPVDSHTD